MAENNSMSTFLQELLRMFNNSIEGFEKVNEAITSSDETVNVNIRNVDGTTSRVTVPSFGFLKNSIDRLQNNINTITNVDGGDSSVRLPDGTFRKLVLKKLPTEALDLTSINSINSFNIKPNWFFEELINPLLFVSFDLTGQAPINTESALVQRFILNTNTRAKVQFFENNFNGRSDIEYFDFLQKIVERNITYVLDEDVISLPPRFKRFSGKFSVNRITEVDFTEEVNGVSVTSRKKQYKLNKLFYTDNDVNFDDTVQLKIGDSLEVIADNIDTRYIVKAIDTSKNTVILDLVEGLKPITIGADVLKIGSGLDNRVRVDVNIGFNERCITFIKPIDPESRIPSVNWSPGVGFYSNDLTTIDDGGREQTLADYYQRNVIDFGKFLLSFAEDRLPTTRDGIIPDAPVLVEDAFKVKLINKQLVESDIIVELEDLNNQKNTLDSSLKELNNTIFELRNRINSTNYLTDVERDADKNSLRGLITEKNSTSELYSSVVNEIEAKSKTSSISTVAPKYRVRGFWPMPKEKSSPSTGTQAIVKFKIRYRYLSQSGAANPVDQFSFNDGIGENQGAFSNYEIIESVLRNRVKNPVTGLFEWDKIENENAEEININQIDIPIRKGEILEFQVKSISEAGWPSNPLESEWSNAVRIEFPQDLSSDNLIESILQKNSGDSAIVTLEERLAANGIEEHLSSSFSANERYFAHDALSIASGFLSENQTPIDLFTKLTEIQAKLKEFSEILSNAKGELNVNLLDDQGNLIKINKNTTTKVFAGFYSNEVKSLDDPKGAIITKTFFINISNSKQTPLRLISRVAGSRLRMVRQSENPNSQPSALANGTSIYPAIYPWLDNSAQNQSDLRPTYSGGDIDYNQIRKYDLVPIVLTNPNVSSDNKFGQRVSAGPYQSSQNKNQFLYSRYSDVSAEETFYSYINPDGDFTINLDTCENFYNRGTFVNAENENEFHWGGGFTANGNPTTASGFNSGLDDPNDTIDVHINHPFLSSYSAYRKAYIELTGDETTLPPTLSSDISCTNTASILFRQSKFSPLVSDEPRGKQQAIYLNEDVSGFSELTGLTFNNSNGQSLEASPSISLLTDYSRNVKTSFEPLDQYLLGKNSCGSYLFIAANDHQTIQVDGDSIQSDINVNFGSNNSINIPIIFQYRMTDYFGLGGGGTGNIAGDSTGSTTNLTYSKKIGFDIWTDLNLPDQYDLEFFARYRPDNLNIDVFPTSTVTRGLGDLERVISDLRPSLD